MIDLSKVIQYFYDCKAKNIRYSMNGSRDGSDGTGDCSGVMVRALEKGGATKPAWLYNTESMHDYLIKNGFQLVAFNKSWAMQRGDIVILGLKGQSSGAGGHTFIAIDNTFAIHCNYNANGVSIDNENTMPYSMGFYVYRLPVKHQTKPPLASNPLDTLAKQVIRGDYGNGETVRKTNIFNDVQKVVNAKIAGSHYQTNNSIEYLATQTLKGSYGNGETRKNTIYNIVQKRVNELLK